MKFSMTEQGKSEAKEKRLLVSLTLPGQFYPTRSINFIGIFRRKNIFDASHVTFFNTNYKYLFFSPFFPWIQE